MNTEKHRLRKILVGAITVLFLLTGRALAQPACGYEVVVVHPSPCGKLGPPPAQGRGINAFGHVAGHRTQCSDQLDRAFLWTPQKGMVDLEMPEDAFRSQALDVNDNGWTVGWVDISGDDLASLGFLHDGRTAITLGTLPGGNWSEALAINNAGQIAGFSGNFIIGGWQAFIWQDGVMTDVGALIGALSSRAFGINEAGAITGRWCENDRAERIAFVWDNGDFTSLGPILGGFTSQGYGINSQGDVAGWGKKFDEKLQTNVRLAFLWTDGQMIDLGVLPGDTESFAQGVNDARQVVGLSWFFGSSSAPFIWEDGVMTDLNDLVPPEFDIDSAWAINNAGEIAGSGEGKEGGFPGMLLLIPKPTPLGDLNGDCEVGVADLLLLLGDWGPCEGCDADLDGNGLVGVKDLLILLDNWG